MKILTALLLASTITAPVEAAMTAKQIATINPSLDKATVQRVAKELAKYPPVVTYIAHRESTFDPKAHARGCIGLMGVNQRVWTKELIKHKVIKRPQDLWTIYGNLKAGWWIYKHYNRNYKRYRGVR